MKPTPHLLLAISLAILPISAAEEVEISGSYQRLVACHETHHVELDMVETPGPDKFSGIRHVLQIPAELRGQWRVGEKLKIVGRKKAATTKRMTKAQVRRHMLDHMTQRQGVPLSCAGMGEIISKLKTANKGGAKAPCGHDHGEMEMVTVEDDQELVEVSVPEHIEVTKIEVLEGGPTQ